MRGTAATVTRALKEAKVFVEQNNKARAARFFVHFFAVTTRLRRENAQSFTFCGGRKQATTKFSVGFLNLDIGLRNSAQEGFACI